MKKILKTAIILAFVSCTAFKTGDMMNNKNEEKNNEVIKTTNTIILNKEMELESIISKNENKINMLDKNVTIMFDNEKVSGRSVVNTYFGGYSVNNGKLNVSNIALTRMAGSKENMLLESTYLQLLNQSNKFEYRGTSLLITTKNNDTLVFVPKISINKKRFILDNNAYIEFKDGNISGKSYVNNFFGKYQLKGDTIVITNIGMTLMAGSQEEMEKETEFINQISGVSKLDYNQGKLKIIKDNKVLEFTEVKIK